MPSVIRMSPSSENSSNDTQASHPVHTGRGLDCNEGTKLESGNTPAGQPQQSGSPSFRENTAKKASSAPEPEQAVSGLLRPVGTLVDSNGPSVSDDVSLTYQLLRRSGW